MKKISLFLAGASTLIVLFIGAFILEPSWLTASIVQEKVYTYPTLEIKGNMLTLHVPSGTSLVSFPYLSKDEAQGIILKKASLSIESIWQADEKKLLNSIDGLHSYYIKTSKNTSIAWKMNNEYTDSVLLEVGKNFPSISAGNKDLASNDIQFNGLALEDAIKAKMIRSFIISTPTGEIDITKTQGNIIPFGAGITIDSNVFGKLTWKLPAGIVKKTGPEDIASKEIKKQEALQKSFAVQIEQRMAKIDKELQKKIIDEVKNIPKNLALLIKNEDTQGIESILPTRQLLLQIHTRSDIDEISPQLEASWWLKYQYLQRKFAVVTSNFEYLSSNNRAIVFLQVPLNISEIDPKTGIDSQFIAFAFVRAKDCTWKIDPAEMNIISQSLKESTIFDSKSLLSILQSHPITLPENEDFTSVRTQCTPSTKSISDYVSGTFFDPNVSTTTTKAESPLLKTHEKQCDNFATLIGNIHPKEISSFVYHEATEKISGSPLPAFNFSLKTCKENWIQIFQQDNINDTINGKLDAVKKDEQENIASITDDETFMVFLGSNPQFDCKAIEEPHKKDICLLGSAMAKESSSVCKSIDDDAFKAYCAGYLAQKKKSYSPCEGVYGKFDKETDSENTDKIMKLRVCKLQFLEVKAKKAEDCKELRDSYFFFFTQSTPSYEKCVSYAEKKEKLSSIHAEE